MTLRRVSLSLVLLIGAAVVQAVAQVPQQEKIHFTAAAPFELKGTNVVLPAGRYVLFQIKPNDRSFFELYLGDMTHSPIALIKTVRIYYDLGRLPDKAKMLMPVDETSPQMYAKLEGWNTPGDYGWRVIEVTPHTKAINAQIHASR